jgi:hypothetical protein
MLKFILTIRNTYIIQVDFGETVTIVAVVTKGLGGTSLSEWVTKYQLKYTNTLSTWTTVPRNPDDVSFFLAVLLKNLRLRPQFQFSVNCKILHN